MVVIKQLQQSLHGSMKMYVDDQNLMAESKKSMHRNQKSEGGCNDWKYQNTGER